MVYTNNGANAQPSFAYSGVSQYFEPDYVSGQMPAINFTFVPFVTVIDLENMVVLTRGPGIAMQQLKNLVSQANN